MNSKKDINNQESTVVELSLPSCVQINLVQANELRHYEINLWLGSIFASATVGFWTAFVTTTSSAGRILFAVSLVFTFFTGSFGCVAYYYRSKIQGSCIKRTTSLDSFK